MNTSPAAHSAVAAIPGRGAAINPPNRFERLNYDAPDPDSANEPNRPLLGGGGWGAKSCERSHGYPDCSDSDGPQSGEVGTGLWPKNVEAVCLGVVPESLTVRG